MNMGTVVDDTLNACQLLLDCRRLDDERIEAFEIPPEEPDPPTTLPPPPPSLP
jgi:hypothetical protein